VTCNHAHKVRPHVLPQTGNFRHLTAGYAGFESNTDQGRHQTGVGRNRPRVRCELAEAARLNNSGTRWKYLAARARDCRSDGGIVVMACGLPSIPVDYWSGSPAQSVFGTECLHHSARLKPALPLPVDEYDAFEYAGLAVKYACPLSCCAIAGLVVLSGGVLVECRRVMQRSPALLIASWTASWLRG